MERESFSENIIRRIMMLILQGSNDYKEFKEVSEREDKMDAFIKEQNMNEKSVCDLETLIYECLCAYEEQGFINGFRYAMILKNEIEKELNG